MRRFSVCGKEFDASVVVFDKDGLLFKSEAFWRELMQARVRAAEKHLNTGQICEWLELMEAGYVCEDDRVRVTRVTPDGVTAVAAPEEEIMITGTLLMQQMHTKWPVARELAREIFEEGDATIDMEAAISPQEGFPDIFRRLYEAGIPYGIATSDNLTRARQSINMYDDYDHLDFVISPTEVAHNKPEPDMIEMVADRYSIKPSQIIMIGDSYVDVMMAKNAGSIGIGIPEFDDMAEKMKPYATVMAQSLNDIQIID